MGNSWRQTDKQLYFPKGVAQLTLPATNYIALTGVGDPNQPAFSDDIQTLYPLAYAIRALLKNADDPYVYSVYPLEGVWTTTDGSRGANLNKAALAYRLMIKQPDQVTPAIFAEAQAIAMAKKGLPKLKAVTFEQLPKAEVVQAIHVGSFDTESETFAQMDAYLTAHQLRRVPIIADYWHREVYLSDFRRVAAAKRKTLLRYRIEI
ncbi:GyrI-like domain-containing protein [Lacticaseibacillus porcinae]|uniref:GyrI-like domain-containing protein n=1 Tax=Lacticaseibacillus porcinae TaxID=1123687 RepID=UPI000F77566C|nr:GyrI-like domain-containing protein [Lacticaseibacillus porcinae]